MVVLNKVHFRLLESFLDRIKTSGGEIGFDVILRKFVMSLSRDAQGPVAYSMKVLRMLKDLGMILNALWEVVDYGLSKAQKELLPVTRHHGILSLPLEIVVQIFRQVHDNDADCATESIPLVNRYFRDIAIETPELWTHLTPSKNPRLFMERNKSLGLEVVLTKGPTYRHFLEMVAPEAERWTSLSVLPRDDFNREEDIIWTRDVTSGKTFTALRELHIERPGRHYDSLRDVNPLCSDWKMPSLRIVKSKNTLPSVQPTSLTCFHLHVGDSYSTSCDADINLSEITTFLQSVPLLTELSLDIGWFRDITIYTGTDVTLPNVTTLRLSVKTWGGWGFSSFTDFLASLHMPNLSNLSVDVTTKFATGLTLWIHEIFPKGNSFWPSLETLNLSMSYEICDYEAFDVILDGSAFHRLMESIPAVRHLSIRADLVDSSLDGWNVQLPHLRTLCFQNCDKFGTGFILAISEIFKAPEFETLTIHNCKNIDTEVVRRIMPEGKALVSTINWTDDISLL